MTRGFIPPLDILSRKLRKGGRRHTTENLSSVKTLAKSFTIETGMLSRHESMDYGEKVEVQEVIENVENENEVSILSF